MGIRIRTRNKIRTMTNYPTGSTTVEREREREREIVGIEYVCPVYTVN